MLLSLELLLAAADGERGLLAMAVRRRVLGEEIQHGGGEAVLATALEDLICGFGTTSG